MATEEAKLLSKASLYELVMAKASKFLLSDGSTPEDVARAQALLELAREMREGGTLAESTFAAGAAVMREIATQEFYKAYRHYTQDKEWRSVAAGDLKLWAEAMSEQALPDYAAHIKMPAAPRGVQ